MPTREGGAFEAAFFGADAGGVCRIIWSAVEGLAETFAWGGFRVVGFDVDEAKVAKLKAGESYIKHISSRRIELASFSSSFCRSATFLSIASLR